MRDSLYVTAHAVEQLGSRYRPGSSPEENRSELEAMVRSAAPTKRRSLSGDAQLYVAISERGERITLAVRDGAVLTVLPADGEGAGLIDMTIDPSLLDESAETVAACRKMAETPPDQRDVDRSRNARQLIERWHKGGHFTVKALRRAHDTLGLHYDGREKP